MKRTMHYCGGIVYSGGTRLGGWAVCCSGDACTKIKEQGNQTRSKELVTCKRCLKLIQAAKDYAEGRTR